MMFSNKPPQKKTLWPEPASELYPPIDRRMSAKLLPTFVNRGCCVVSTTDPYGRILGFLDHVPEPLLLRKSGSAGNRTNIK
jgi:hypothetical protein